MNGQERVRLQRKAGVREIVADIDALKVKYGFSRIKILTPRAEVNLRLGKKSLKPIRVQFEYSPNVTAVFCFTMEYPSAPLMLESLDCTVTTEEGEVLRMKAEDTLKNYLEMRSGAEEGYAVHFTQLFNECEWPTTPRLIESECIADDDLDNHDSNHGGSDNNDILDKDNADERSNEESNTIENDLTVLNDLSIFRIEDQACQTAEPLMAKSDNMLFKCRKCRGVIFTTDDFADGHGYRTQSSERVDERIKCRALLLDPQRVQWISELVKSSCATSGNLPCPHCFTKLGTYDWSGAKCTCGWIAPSFRITESKVDAPL